MDFFATLASSHADYLSVVEMTKQQIFFCTRPLPRYDNLLDVKKVFVISEQLSLKLARQHIEKAA